jgi:hypothetical protein
LGVINIELRINMKKYYLPILIILVVVLAAISLMLLRGDEDNWICSNGEWVMHGHPSAPMPTKLCSGVNQNNQACTMEAKICPDGSAVGRQGPNCEFADCPLAKMANPASVNCQQQGGNLVIQTRGDGGQYGLCYFEDNRACEEWALMRGDCPVGGVKTTGFDTEAQKFCAWSGGSTFAQPNAVCTFKDGSKCSNDAFYSGICQKGESLNK